VTAAKPILRRVATALRLTPLLRLWRLLRLWNPLLLWQRARFWRWNRGAGREEMVLRPGLRLAVDARSRQPFEWFCFRSREMVTELDAFRREMAGRRRFLDVGACHGIFSLVFVNVRPEAAALAVEPSAIAFSILTENVRLGRLRNVVARQVACGAAAGELRMRQLWHHLEALPAPAASSAGDDDPVVAVPMQSVDELCADLDFQPDLVKVDVEGYELAVLRGARATLGRYRPPLFLELHPQRLRELGGSVEEVVDLLAGLGYGFRSLGGAPLGRRSLAGRESVFRIMAAHGLAPSLPAEPA